MKEQYHIQRFPRPYVGINTVLGSEGSYMYKIVKVVRVRKMLGYQKKVTIVAYAWSEDEAQAIKSMYEEKLLS